MAKIHKFISLSICILLGLACSSLPKNVIPRSAFWQGWERGTPYLSPTEDKIAYWGQVHDRSQLIVRDLATNEEKTLGIWKLKVRRDAGSVIWMQDGKHILFEVDHNGDENYHLYSIDIDTDDAFDLTPFPNATSYLVAQSLKNPNQILVAANRDNKEVFDLYRVDLQEGKIILEARNPGTRASWIVDDDLNLLGAVVRAHDRHAIKFFDNTKKSWGSEILLQPEFYVDEYFGLAPDKNHLWISSYYKSDTSRLLELNMHTGAFKVLSEDAEYDFGDIFVNPVSKEISEYVYYKAKKDRTILPDIKDHFDKIQGALGEDFHLVSTRKGHWIVDISHDVKAPSFYLYDLQTKTLRYLFDTYPRLQEYQLAEMTPFEFKARDGLLIHGYYTVPRGPAVGALMVVHGGPQSRDYWGFSEEIQWLASRGYVVIQVNFRGSSGYGKKFEFAGNRQWGAKMLTDLVDAKKWAEKKALIDPNRICIYGYSYGGYATLSALAFAPGEFKCGISVNGISDLKRWVSEIPPYWKPYTREIYRRVGVPGTDDHLMDSRSPITKADAMTAPLLLVQSDSDVRVRRDQGDLLYKELKKLKKPVQYLVMPDAGHQKLMRRLSLWAAIEDFLEKNLGGIAEGNHGRDDDYDDLIQ